MRWDRLFADLEAQLDVLERAELAAEVVEHTRAERGQIELAHRLVSAVDGPTHLKVSGLGWVHVRLLDVGTDWLLTELDSSAAARGRELLIPLPAVYAVEGLRHTADARPAAVSRRFGLRHALRVLSRDRAPVRIHDRDGDHVSGTIDRVLADHLDLARHPGDEPRRTDAVKGMLSVPFAALAAVRRL